MRTLKNIAAITIAVAIWVGLPAVASALPNDLTFVSTFNVHPDNPTATTSAAQTIFNDPDLVDCFRADAPGTFNIAGVGTFTITQDPTLPAGDPGPTYFVTWTLDAGMVLAGVHFKGGSNGGNWYSAGDLNSGQGDGHTPITGGSGKFADLSHLDFFCEPGRVPDGGTTAILLGSALAGLGVLSRYLKS